jgi:transposase-like protein
MKVAGQWVYLYRASGQDGQVIGRLPCPQCGDD